MDEFKSFNDFREEEHREEYAPVPGKAAGVETEYADAPEGHGGPSASDIKRYALIAGGAAVAVFLALLLLPVPFGEVRLSGNTSVALEDVLFDGGIKDPVNVLQISTSELKTRLEKDLRIESAEVSRSFPAAIEVRLTERVPLAVVQSQFGYVYLDRSGTVIRTARAIRDLNIPIITGVKLEHMLLGESVTKKEVLSALTFIDHLSSQGAGLFSEVNVGNAERIVAYTRDGIPVRLGEGDRMDERAALAENMVGTVKTRKLFVEYIDASLTSPFYKFRN